MLRYLWYSDICDLSWSYFWIFQRTKCMEQAHELKMISIDVHFLFLDIIKISIWWHEIVHYVDKEKCQVRILGCKNGPWASFFSLEVRLKVLLEFQLLIIISNNEFDCTTDKFTFLQILHNFRQLHPTWIAWAPAVAFLAFPQVLICSFRFWLTHTPHITPAFQISLKRSLLLSYMWTILI